MAIFVNFYNFLFDLAIIKPESQAVVAKVVNLAYV
jgi:hypothetical protein